MYLDAKKTVRITKPKASWLTYPIKQILKEKEKSYSKYKLNKTPQTNLGHCGTLL